MIWIPPAAWRTTPTYGNAVLPPERAAITGRLMRIPGDPGSVVEPLLPLRDLAVLLGAANPPPAPSPWIFGAIEEADAGTRPRRRDDDGDPAPAFPDARETVSAAGGDPWRQQDGASVFGHGRPVPSGSVYLAASIRPRTGSYPLNAGAWGATDGLVDAVRANGPEPEPRSPPVAHEPGPMVHSEAVEVPPDRCAGQPPDFGSGADASPIDEAGCREPPEQTDIGEAGRGRVGSAGEGRYDGETIVSHGPLGAGTGSAPMAFGTGSNAAREAHVGRKTGEFREGGSPSVSESPGMDAAGAELRNRDRSLRAVGQLAGGGARDDHAARIDRGRLPEAQEVPARRDLPARDLTRGHAAKRPAAR